MTGLENVEAVFRLSPLQEGMLYHSISSPEGGVFVTQIVLEMTGELDASRLRAAWSDVMRAHAPLRTAFLWEGLDEPVQVVRGRVDVPWRVIDAPSDFDAWLATDRARGFDLTDAPPMRLVLATETVGWRLIWSFHHMMLDGWSANILLRDVFRRYAGASIKPSADYGEFVERALSADAGDFWAKRFESRDEPSVLSDPLAGAGKGHRHLRLRLSVDETRNLTEFSRANRLTLNTVVLGAWARCCASLGDDPFPVIGTTMTTRPDDIEGIEEAVGVYINTLPLEIPVDDRPIDEWLRSVQAEQRALLPHCLASLADIQRKSGMPPGTALFDSIVVFENLGTADDAIAEALTGTGLDVRVVSFLDQSNYPLALLAIPGERLTFELVYDCARFGDMFAQGLLDALARVLGQFVHAPGRPVSEVALAPVPTGQAEAHAATLLPYRIASQPRDNVALIHASGRLTHAELDDWATRLAGALCESGVRPGNVIGLYARRGPDFVAGMLAILKAGAAFAPLDPGYPEAYTRAAARNADLQTVVTSDDLVRPAQEFAETVLTTQATGNCPHVALRADDPAYVVHTSGSQGEPKGVIVTHGNIAYSTAARQPVYGGAPERFLLLSPVAFDSAMVGLFWPLAEGGAIVLPESGQEQDIASITDLIRRERITHLLCIPSLWRLVLDFADPSALRTLDTVIVAGEPCPSDLPPAHRATLPWVRLFNEYGPSEATVWCLANEVTNVAGRVPIGLPIPGTSAYILDRWGQPVPDGFPGELRVAGPGIAREYLNRGDETAPRFGDDPFCPRARAYRTGDLVCRGPDGAHHYLGRVDEQIKINGFRIEPGEIAGVLTGHPHVAEAEVMLVSPGEPAMLAELLAALPEAEANRILAELE